ncbi:RNA polymerase sigma factor [bacterium]|nr:MAG: RNA polymerase sigma factor [bacterium]
MILDLVANAGDISVPGLMAIPKELEKTTVLKARDGSLEAFEQILFHYEKVIFNYVYRLTSHRQEAEDLTQETFLKLYKNLSRIDPQKNLKSWIYRIATNTVYDWFRKKKNHQELFLIDDPENPFEIADDHDASQNMEKIENAEVVAKALEKVKPIYKTVLLLFYYQDFSYDEIADILSLPLNTVKTYLHRGRASLAEILKNPYI